MVEKIGRYSHEEVIYLFYSLFFILYSLFFILYLYSLFFILYSFLFFIYIQIRPHQRCQLSWNFHLHSGFLLSPSFSFPPFPCLSISLCFFFFFFSFSFSFLFLFFFLLFVFPPSQKCLPHMKKNGWGHIINMSPPIDLDMLDGLLNNNS